MTLVSKIVYIALYAHYPESFLFQSPHIWPPPPPFYASSFLSSSSLQIKKMRCRDYIARVQESVFELWKYDSGGQDLNNYPMLVKWQPLILNYTDISSFYWFIARGDCAPRGHLTMFGDIFGCYKVEAEVMKGSWCPTTKTYPARNVHSTKVGSLSFSCYYLCLYQGCLEKLQP